jgi:hypothetical protein
MPGKDKPICHPRTHGAKAKERNLRHYYPLEPKEETSIKLAHRRF